MTKTVTEPWLEDVQGNQVHDIINLDDDTILVEAGPGTGKTFGLVRRVQRIVHPEGLGVPGEEVLVVAFNREIAKQLKQDIDKCLEQSPHEGEPVIFTIHALCLVLYSEVMDSSPRILLPHEEEAMLYDVLCEHPELHEKYKTHRHAKQAFHNHVARIEKHIQLEQAIQRWLVQHNAQPIGELPHIILGKLKGGEFADKIYQHIIVDEFQDLTSGEQELFLKLKGQEGKFVALGDPRQSIYAFRGNDREGMDKIGKLSASSKKISMTECRRCPEEIVEAANQLMGLYETEPMIPKSNVSANTHVVVWKSLRTEAAGMAKKIIKNLQAHPKKKHLVMVTRRQFGYRLREEIAKLNLNLKIQLSFSETLLETWAVREAFLYFCLLVDPDPPTWRAWFGYQNSNDGRQFKASKRNADAYLKLLAKYNDEITEGVVEEIANCPKQPSGEGGKRLWKRAKRFVELKKQLQWDSENALTLLNEVFDTSKWNGDQSPDPETAKLDMELISSKACDIYQELENPELEDPELTVQEQLKEVAIKLRYGIATRDPFVANEQSDLHVATLWGAKGVTADHVYIIGLCDEAIPGYRRDEYPGTEKEFFEEQQRLFYVSITPTTLSER